MVKVIVKVLLISVGATFIGCVTGYQSSDDVYRNYADRIVSEFLTKGSINSLLDQNDPWGRPLFFVKGETGYVIVSHGKERENRDDDIVIINKNDALKVWYNYNGVEYMKDVTK